MCTMKKPCPPYIMVILTIPMFQLYFLPILPDFSYLHENQCPNRATQVKLFRMNTKRIPQTPLYYNFVATSQGGDEIISTTILLLYFNYPALGLLNLAKLDAGDSIVQLLAVLTDGTVLNLHYAVTETKCTYRRNNRCGTGTEYFL